MSEFEHERMQVYQAAIELLVLADATAAALPRGRAYLADHNIAEGAGEFSPPDKARFYRIARRSATESAAIIDACRVLGLADETTVTTSRVLLLRVVAMLTALVKTLSG